MNDTQWVQHKSGQGEKWKVHAESTQVWYCLFNGKPYEGNLVLPKLEYVICEPPEVWNELRAKLAEREAELAQLKKAMDPIDQECCELQAKWKAEAQWVASLALCGGPVTPKDAQRFQNILKGEL